MAQAALTVHGGALDAIVPAAPLEGGNNALRRPTLAPRERCGEDEERGQDGGQGAEGREPGSTEHARDDKDPDQNNLVDTVAVAGHWRGPIASPVAERLVVCAGLGTRGNPGQAVTAFAPGTRRVPRGTLPSVEPVRARSSAG